MKVVLFCGGFGMRMREFSEAIPKPMVPIGYRPILWHVMKYYAHYGHKDFILCLGYKADVIKSYFLEYDECLSNDFVLSKGGEEPRAARAATSTTGTSRSSTPGLTTNIGGRLKAVQKHLSGEDDLPRQLHGRPVGRSPPSVIEGFEQERGTSPASSA